MRGIGRQGMVAAALVGVLMVLGDPVAADNAQPVYLDVEELGPGTLKVVWKVPASVEPPAVFGPVFPAGYKPASRVEKVRTADGILRTWTVAGGPAQLAGQTLRIRGLEQTAADGLVRVRLADGTLHRGVLRPTSPEFLVPAGGANPGEPGPDAGPLGGISGAWPYLALLAGGWLLSLTPAARRRGVVLCAVALVAGSLGGRAVGGYAARSDLFAPAEPSVAETKKILQGVLLNTYRAFILEDEELAYDVLARGVGGEYLQEVYLKHRESLRTDAQGEALSLVQRLDIKDIVSLKAGPGGSLIVVADWDVYGSVLHWDHIHFRCNAYRAELTLVPAGNYWKLSGIQLLAEERVI